MNRNVMQRQMFANGGTPMPMAPEAMAAGPEQMDPQVLEGAMVTASENFGALDNAQDYEEVIDSIRGDALPIEQRYQELAQFVGPQDAQQTPESVLAMVQPVIQMAAVDGGIGGLASEEMNAEVSGPMAEGIMSTIAMEGGEEPPVNFNQGGDARRNTKNVRYYADGGPIQYFADTNDQRVVQPTAVQKEFQSLLPSYMDVAGSDPAAYDKQRNLTQSQMLFDIAGAGLALAGGDGSKSFAQNLADAARNTQLFDKLSARTQSLSDFKTKQDSQDKALKLSVLQSAQSTVASREAAAAAVAAQPVSDDNWEGTHNGITVHQGPLTKGLETSLKAKYPEIKFNIIYKPKKSVLRNVLSADGSKVVGVINEGDSNAVEELKKIQIKFPDSYLGTTPKPLEKQGVQFNNGEVSYFDVGSIALNNALAQNGAKQVNDATIIDITVEPRKQVTLTQDVTLNGETYRSGTSPNFSNRELNEIGLNSYTAYEPPVSDQDYFNKFKMSKEEFNKLDKNTQQFLQGLPVLTNKDYFGKFGMSEAEYKDLSPTQKQIMLGLEDKFTYKTIDDGGVITLQQVNERTGEVKQVLEKDLVVEPSYMKVTLPQLVNGKEISVSSIVDMTTREGKAIVKKINAQNIEKPGSATYKKIGTEQTITPVAYFSPSLNQVVVSYDNGKTFQDEKGQIQVVPPESFPIGDENSFQTHKEAQYTKNALSQIKKINAKMLSQLIGPNGEPLENADRKTVGDVYDMVSKGTGLWSNVLGATNAIVGALAPAAAAEFFADLFSDTTDARNYVAAIRLAGRSAFTNSPRFAVTEMEAQEVLFPDERKIITNPETQVRTIANMGLRIDEEMLALNEILVTGPTSEVRSKINRKLFELNKLQRMISPFVALNSKLTGGLSQAEEDAIGSNLLFDNKP